MYNSEKPDTNAIPDKHSILEHAAGPDRSLLYLCRSFDNLNKGMGYNKAKPAIQIGLLNFTLFPNEPEFFSTYWIMNEKTHRIYSDKLRLSVVDLTKRDIATKGDRSYGIDQWAAFYKATTWEEIKMLAKSNPYIKAAAETTFTLGQKETIRMQCEAREEYYARQRDHNNLVVEAARKDDTIAEQKASLAQKDEVIAEKDKTIAEKDETIAEKDETIAEKDETIQRYRQKMIDYGINPDE